MCLDLDVFIMLFYWDDFTCFTSIFLLRTRGEVLQVYERYTSVVLTDASHPE